MKSHKVVEHVHLASIYEYLTHDLSQTLIVFDIDNTLIRPQGWVGGSSWFERMLREKVASGLTGQEAYTQMIELCINLQPYLTWISVEQNTCSIVQQLKQRGASVIAMTGRGPEQHALTVQQLDQVGINFDFLVPTQPRMSDSYTTHQGIVFSAWLDKGKVLIDLLNTLEKPITQILFIDDVAKNVHAVERSLIYAQRDLAFIGIRYAHLDAHIATFDPVVAEKEYHHVLARISQQRISK